MARYAIARPVHVHVARGRGGPDFRGDVDPALRAPRDVASAFVDDGAAASSRQQATRVGSRPAPAETLRARRSSATASAASSAIARAVGVLLDLGDTVWIEAVSAE